MRSGGRKMKALITGASSGIGRDMAEELAKRGYNLILAARRRDRLEEISAELCKRYNICCEVTEVDLAKSQNCYELYENIKDKDIDILINNAGFGIFGEIAETSNERELELIDVNIKALHLLTKMFITDFSKKNGGYIMNVASIAGFMPGPKMACYYASKNYVQSFTLAVYEELRQRESNVKISCLCPGPVKTEFSEVAKVKFGIGSMTSEATARIAIRNMLRGKLIIIPGIRNKLSVFMMKFVPRKILLRVVSRMQSFKEKI